LSLFQEFPGFVEKIDKGSDAWNAEVDGVSQIAKFRFRDERIVPISGRLPQRGKIALSLRMFALASGPPQVHETLFVYQPVQKRCAHDLDNIQCVILRDDGTELNACTCLGQTNKTFQLSRLNQSKTSRRARGEGSTQSPSQLGTHINDNSNKESNPASEVQ